MKGASIADSVISSSEELYALLREYETQLRVLQYENALLREIISLTEET